MDLHESAVGLYEGDASQFQFLQVSMRKIREGNLTVLVTPDDDADRTVLAAFGEKDHAFGVAGGQLLAGDDKGRTVLALHPLRTFLDLVRITRVHLQQALDVPLSHL